MLNTKDCNKVQYYEEDFYNKTNNFDPVRCHCGFVWSCECAKRAKFRVTDDSLKDVGIKKGKVLKCSEDFDPIKDEGCLFIISLSGGDMLARFVEIHDNDSFSLFAANEQIPDVVAVAEYTDVIGLVIPRIKRPVSALSHWR